MSGDGNLLFAPTLEGFIVRVIKRGTFQQSPTLREFTLRCVKRERLTLVLDLSACLFVDSTFLGCLVGLNQNCNPEHNRRFQVYASCDENVRRLFGFTQLQTLLHFVESLPGTLEDFREMSGTILDDVELGHHIREAHERLARLGGPEAAQFQSVADQLAADLRGRQASGGGRRDE